MKDKTLENIKNKNKINLFPKTPQTFWYQKTKKIYEKQITNT